MGRPTYSSERPLNIDVPGARKDFAQTTAGKIFASPRLTLSVTAEKHCAAAEAIQIPAGVSCAVSAGILEQCNSSYDGGLGVLSSILSCGYLTASLAAVMRFSNVVMIGAFIHFYAVAPLAQSST